MSPPYLPQPSKDQSSTTRGGELIVHHHSTRPLLLSSPVLAELQAQVVQGAQLAPRGGAEVGGFLVAQKRRAGWIHVERLEPLRIEYCFGPSFRLSARDLEGLERLATSIGNKEVVVGLYRSSTRHETGLRDSDREICQAILAHSPSPADFRYLMLLTSQAEGVISAEVAQRENGDWDDWQKYTLQSAAPIASEELIQAKTGTDSAAERVATPVVQNGTATAVAAPGPQPAVARASVGGRQSKWWIYAAASIIIILFASLMGLLAPRRAAIPNSGFAARPENGVWKLTWNRESLAAMDASEAILSIQDGDTVQQIPLTGADLASGTLFYVPKSANLIFELQVLRPRGGPAKERVRVVADPSSVFH